MPNVVQFPRTFYTCGHSGMQGRHLGRRTLDCESHVPDEILTTLQLLQKRNHQLRRDLRRQTRAAADARIQLETFRRSGFLHLVAAHLTSSATRKGTVRALVRFWRRFGTRETIRRAWIRFGRITAGCESLPVARDEQIPCSDDFRHRRYEEWIDRREPDEAELQRQRECRLPSEPMISLVAPLDATPVHLLIALLESVREQTFPNWELCIAGTSGQDKVIESVLEFYSRIDGRIHIQFLESRDIACNANAALKLASGEFVGFARLQDVLAPFALFEFARALNDHPQTDLLYSDEDRIDESGERRFDPAFKPAWSPDTLRSHNYIGQLVVYRRALLNQLGGIRAGFEGAEDYDLALRATEQAQQIVHIPQVLYHARSLDHPTHRGSGVARQAADAAERALADHLQRLGIEGDVASSSDGFTFSIQRALRSRPLISVVIPNRDAARHLEASLQSLKASGYDNLEILIVENNSKEAATFRLYEQIRNEDSRVHLLVWNGPFNYAAIHNHAIRQARGELLLLLNNDVEARHPDWIVRMLEHAVRDDVGAVGAKLYYPNDTIQHGGVLVGMHDVAGHRYRGYPGNSLGDAHCLRIIQNVSAVTAACLMLRKDVFDAVDGFDERFAVTFNDIDLCLKTRALGKLVVWTPHARLWHYESLTRGSEVTLAQQIRLTREVRLFREKWKDVLAAGDPYYNPNLSLHSINHVADPAAAHAPQARSVAPVASLAMGTRRVA